MGQRWSVWGQRKATGRSGQETRRAKVTTPLRGEPPWDAFVRLCRSLLAHPPTCLLSLNPSSPLSQCVMRPEPPEDTSSPSLRRSQPRRPPIRLLVYATPLITSPAPFPPPNPTPFYALLSSSCSHPHPGADTGFGDGGGRFSTKVM